MSMFTPEPMEKLAVEPRGSKLFHSIIAPAIVWPSLVSDALRLFRLPQTVPVMTLIKMSLGLARSLSFLA
jgi:hypothetical protein